MLTYFSTCSLPKICLRSIREVADGDSRGATISLGPLILRQHALGIAPRVLLTEPTQLSNAISVHDYSKSERLRLVRLEKKKHCTTTHPQRWPFTIFDIEAQGPRSLNRSHLSSGPRPVSSIHRRPRYPISLTRRGKRLPYH